MNLDRRQQLIADETRRPLMGDHLVIAVRQQVLGGTFEKSFHIRPAQEIHRHQMIEEPHHDRRIGEAGLRLAR